MRRVEIERNTNETRIQMALNLDGSGRYQNDTGCGFLNHMLDLFARHGRFDLTVRCQGDMQVDAHHTVEDVGIVLGMAFKQALGDMRGITRYGSMLLPMDEALVLCAVDISGRAHLQYQAQIPSQKVGDFDTELAKEFFLAFCRSLNATLHIRQLDGENSHHIIEAMFKAFGRAMSQAVAMDERSAGEIPSTKGVL